MDDPKKTTIKAQMSKDYKDGDPILVRHQNGWLDATKIQSVRIFSPIQEDGYFKLIAMVRQGEECVAHEIASSLNREVVEDMADQLATLSGIAMRVDLRCDKE